MQAPHSTAAIAAEILGPHSTTVLDVGARWGAGGAWWRVDPLATMIGFDPDAEECARLNEAAADRQERYVPAALGRTAGTARFYETAEPACSSLYPPDEDLISRFPSLKVIRVVRTGDVELTTLDQWAEADQPGPISFVKLDTQGSEWDILRGGEQALRDCLGMEIEVHFSPLYRGAPHFSQLDTYLRERGFVLWRLNELCHYTQYCTRATTTEDTTHYGDLAVTSPAGSGRLTWGNAVYFKDYYDDQVSGKGPQQPLILASLLDGLGDVDAAAGCLRQTLAHHRDALGRDAGDLITARIDQLNQEKSPVRIDANLHRPGADAEGRPSSAGSVHAASSAPPRHHLRGMWKNVVGRFRGLDQSRRR